MKTCEANLWDTKNSTLLGDIGEAIALHYLSSHGFFIVTRPVKLLHGKLSLISAHYQIKPPKIDYGRWLTEEQKEYLETFPSWDYVAFKLEGMKRSSPYIIEVKTVKGRGSPHKKPKSNAVSEAKVLGFKPTLVIVRLLENWNISVQANEL
ncbi:hypothetical protein KEJ18_07580 [Candidatus Bathyarchaeota archaeon]|nr:hypothetical protein [Candidatus Bathyarchaeota archaeon]